jgi:hypothetical protein
MSRIRNTDYSCFVLSALKCNTFQVVEDQLDSIQQEVRAEVEARLAEKREKRVPATGTRNKPRWITFVTDKR